ncbi:MAG: glycine cleavage system protein GcvH [Spirochaetales bacterium]|nr:glycine cleavage system protein GcvH [Spirochaetales bacterium]
MAIPQDRKYAQSHEWARTEGSIVYVGITEHAQHSLGEIVFVELPETGTAVSKGDEVTTIESVKAASAIYAPVSGTVVKVNNSLEDAPETINQDAHGTFIFALEMTDPTELDGLLDAQGYQTLVDADNQD